MIEVQKFEVVKMVATGSIKAAYTVSVGSAHKLTFSTSELGQGQGNDKGLILVTQKGGIKEFKTLDAVRSFLADVKIHCFVVCG